jgi:peptidyl-prolyl cis-trans isomerase B (cyclophilin B)
LVNYKCIGSLFPFLNLTKDIINLVINNSHDFWAKLLEIHLFSVFDCLILTKIYKMKGIIRTSKGDMTVEFYEKDAPNTVANFVKLAKEGYYNGLKWHRVIPDFVIQGGCPNTRDGANGMPGTGGPGYKIDCELTGENQYHDRGVLSMAHAGRNTGGSQFFVCHSRNNTAHLDRNHTCFGKVVEGVDVVDDIRQGDAILAIDIIED